MIFSYKNLYYAQKLQKQVNNKDINSKNYILASKIQLSTN